MFLKANAYVKSHDEQTQWFYFLIENDDLLENYNTFWHWYKKEFQSKPVYNKTFLKTTIKSCGDELQIFMIRKFLRWTLIAKKVFFWKSIF